MSSSEMPFETLRIRVLGDGQMERLHLATLEVLERTGVQITDPTARELLDAAGANISNDGRVRMPAFLVQNALDSAPKRIVLYDRLGQPSLFLEGHRPYFGPCQGAPGIIDAMSGVRRPFVSADTAWTTRLADALPNYDFVMYVGLWAADMDPRLAERLMFNLSVANTSKVIGFGSCDRESIADVIEAAAIVAGGYEDLEDKPFIFHQCEPISPLLHVDESIQKLLICADRGVPVTYVPMSMSGGSAPVSLAANIVVGNADCLAGLVVHQLRRPGAPFIYGSIPCMMDMQTTVCSYGAPELVMLTAAHADLAHYYGLPMFGTAGIGDAIDFDAQAAAEAALQCYTSILSGANLIHDVGGITQGLYLSPSYIVFIDELLGMLKHAVQGVQVTDDTLCLDLIDTIGPGGSFVAAEHTLHNFRSWWYPRDLLRMTYEQWQERGLSSLNDRLDARVRELIAQHTPASLRPEVEVELRELERKWQTNLASG